MQNTNTATAYPTQQTSLEGAAGLKTIAPSVGASISQGNLDAEAKVLYEDIKVYSTSTAVAWGADTAKAKPGVRPFETIYIEAAPALLREPGAKHTRYDWDSNKTKIQVSRAELLDVIAVLLGYSRQCEFGNHRTPNDPVVKSYRIEHQGAQIYFKLTGAEILACPIALPMAIQIAHLALQQYLKNYPGITSDTVISSLVRMRQALASVEKQHQTAASGQVHPGR